MNKIGNLKAFLNCRRVNFNNNLARQTSLHFFSLLLYWVFLKRRPKNEDLRNKTLRSKTKTHPQKCQNDAKQFMAGQWCTTLCVMEFSERWNSRDSWM